MRFEVFPHRGKNPEVKKEVRDNTVTIRKPEGKYTIAYGVHFNSERGSYIPEDTDGIVGEDGLLDTDDGLGPNNKGTNEEPYVRYASENRIPLYKADLPIKGKIVLAEMVLVAFEATVGSVLFAKMVQRLKQSPISRREFLKGVAGTAAAGWLVAPAVMPLIRMESVAQGTSEEETAELQRGLQQMHPEAQQIITTLRDVVTAQKLYYLMANKERTSHRFPPNGQAPYTEQAPNHSHLTITRGAGHVGLETALECTEEERLDFLRRAAPLLPYVTDKRVFARIEEFVQQADGQWNQLGVEIEPKLEEIAKIAFVS